MTAYEKLSAAIAEATSPAQLDFIRDHEMRNNERDLDSMQLAKLRKALTERRQEIGRGEVVIPRGDTVRGLPGLTMPPASAYVEARLKPKEDTGWVKQLGESL